MLTLLLAAIIYATKLWFRLGLRDEFIQENEAITRMSHSMTGGVFWCKWVAVGCCQCIGTKYRDAVRPNDGKIRNSAYVSMLVTQPLQCIPGSRSGCGDQRDSHPTPEHLPRPLSIVDVCIPAKK